MRAFIDTWRGREGAEAPGVDAMLALLQALAVAVEVEGGRWF